MDFPQFPDIHHLIPQVLDLRPKHRTERDYHQIDDPDKWEIYVKYRKIVSLFLTDHTRFSISLPPFEPRRYADFVVDQEHYVRFAKYLSHFLWNDLR